MDGRRRAGARAVGVDVLLLCVAAPLAAQGYRLRLDSRVQSVAIRGVVADSILHADAVADSTGALSTPDGYAVTCVGTSTYCSYYRPGPVQRGGPFVTSADVSLWGLGIEGLSARANARLGVDVGSANVWPGTDPAVQLLEGYLDYTRGALTAEAGRLQEINRFGYTGFDGALATGRLFEDRLSATAYGGWGLARGVALPVNSPALQPLDEYQPADRQLVAGGDLSWRLPWTTGRIVYQRQVDRRSQYFVSERGGVDLSLRPTSRLSLAGGADYDFAEGWWGSWDASATYRIPHDVGNVTAGFKRYRPFFDLWTIWGAFSPVPYHDWYADVDLHPDPRLALRSRGEVYSYGASGTDTPLMHVDSTGWRWSVGATVTPVPRLSLSGDYHLEFGPGASARSFETYATWSPRQQVTVSAQVAKLQRPLEFRYDESDVWAYGVNASYQAAERIRFDAGVLRYVETRARPDAGAFDWTQWRVNAGMSVILGSGADRSSLPDAILRIPEAGGAR